MYKNKSKKGGVHSSSGVNRTVVAGSDLSGSTPNSRVASPVLTESQKQMARDEEDAATEGTKVTAFYANGKYKYILLATFGFLASACGAKRERTPIRPSTNSTKGLSVIRNRKPEEITEQVVIKMLRRAGIEQEYNEFDVSEKAFRESGGKVNNQAYTNSSGGRNMQTIDTLFFLTIEMSNPSLADEFYFGHRHAISSNWYCGDEASVSTVSAPYGWYDKMFKITPTGDYYGTISCSLYGEQSYPASSYVDIEFNSGNDASYANVWLTSSGRESHDLDWDYMANHMGWKSTELTGDLSLHEIIGSVSIKESAVVGLSYFENPASQIVLPYTTVQDKMTAALSCHMAYADASTRRLDARARGLNPAIGFVMITAEEGVVSFFIDTVGGALIEAIDGIVLSELPNAAGTFIATMTNPVRNGVSVAALEFENLFGAATINFSGIVGPAQGGLPLRVAVAYDAGQTINIAQLIETRIPRVVLSDGVTWSISSMRNTMSNVMSIIVTALEGPVPRSIVAHAARR